MSHLNDLGQPIGFPVAGWTPRPRPTGETLVGRYVRLERLAEGHSADLHAANMRDTDGRSWTYMGYGPFASEAEHRAWLVKTGLGDDPLFYTLVDVATGKAAGVAAYLRIDHNVGSIEVGHIHYSPLLQTTRGATEAMYLMMKHAFGLGYRRYEWKCDALNAPSRVAASRLGLSYEGTFRQATLYKGRNRDTAWYATVDADWPALARAFEAWLEPSNFDAAGKQKVRLSDATRGFLRAPLP